MKKSRLLMSSATMCLLAVICDVGWANDKTEPKGKGKKEPQPQIVGEIVEIEYVEEEIKPPNLVVTATGKVPTAGYTKPTLLRVSYDTPPDDGIQDYFLLATPPSGPAAQVVSKVKATNTWKGFEASWIKGIRVHGVGDGTMVKVFSDATANNRSSNERTFEGESNDGNIQDALDAALKELDTALDEGSVADALAAWKITKVTGQRGGIAGLRKAKVTITAIRSPDWHEK